MIIDGRKEKRKEEKIFCWLLKKEKSLTAEKYFLKKAGSKSRKQKEKRRKRKAKDN